jgi:restriction system protein
MASYYRLMLGQKSIHAAQCFAEDFIGADFGIEQDLADSLPDDWREFNKRFIPIYLSNRPEKTRIGAGLACGALWTVAKGILKGDLVFCPDGEGVYRVGEITGDYFYKPGPALPHRRSVRWLPIVIARSAMSEVLRNSAGSIGTVSNIDSHRMQIQSFLAGNNAAAVIVAADTEVEDPAAFALEEHLEHFLVKNWSQTELSKSFSIFEDDGELVGKQYRVGVAGRIDILAVSKDRQRLLVIEMKRGRTSDIVVGQTLRYMGYVMSVLAEPHQRVEGVIIALEDDEKLRLALLAVPSITFYRYQISFKLVKT